MTDKEKELLKAAVELKQAEARIEKQTGIKFKPEHADKIIAAAEAGQKYVEL